MHRFIFAIALPERHLLRQFFGTHTSINFLSPVPACAVLKTYVFLFQISIVWRFCLLKLFFVSKFYFLLLSLLSKYGYIDRGVRRYKSTLITQPRSLPSRVRRTLKCWEKERAPLNWQYILSWSHLSVFARNFTKFKVIICQQDKVEVVPHRRTKIRVAVKIREKYGLV